MSGGLKDFAGSSADKLARRYRPTIVILLPAAVVLGALIALFNYAFKEIDRRVNAPEENLIWAISQLEHEYHRLHMTGLTAERDGGQAALEELQLRHEIFVSRVNMLRAPMFRPSLERRPIFLATLDSVEVVIGQADLILAEAPDAGVRQTAHRLLEVLAPLQSPLRQATVDTSELFHELEIDYQMQMQHLLIKIALVFTVLAAGLIAVLTLVWAQHRRLRQSHETLSILSQDLYQANQTKGRFLANMSHELRTPLNAVLGFSEIMRDQYLGSLSERYRAYAEDIYSSAKHLLELINDVLDLSKLEAGQRKLDLGEVSIGKELSYVTRLLAGEAHERGVTLVREVGSDLPPVFADRLAVRQVLLNLVSNAVKFSHAGDRIEIVAAEEQGDLRISVVDRGIGIASGDLERVLEPFEQVRSDVTKPAEGTGLGLPLSKGLVELHGGRFWIESRLGKGTTVSFTLPLTAQPADAAAVAEQTRLSA